MSVRASESVVMDSSANDSAIAWLAVPLMSPDRDSVGCLDLEIAISLMSFNSDILITSVSPSISFKGEDCPRRAR